MAGTALLALLFAAAPSACRRHHAETAEPNHVELDTIAQGILAIEPLLATLSIYADLPPLDAFAGGSDAPAGWIFVDGQLVGRMPARMELRVAAGSYTATAVLASRSEAGVSLWTLKVRVSAAAGETVAVELGEALREWVVDGVQREGVAYAKLEPEPVVPDTVLPDASGEASLELLSSLLSERWRRFLESDEWKPVAEAYGRLEAAPPSRPRAWLDLPDPLGGPRELDAEQLGVLAALYHGMLRDRFAVRLPEVWRYDELGQPRPAAEGFQRLYDEQQSWIALQSAAVDSVFAKMATALGRAAEGAADEP